MAYVHRRVKAGRTIEHRKMQSYRIHTKGVQRGPNHGTTSEKQAKVNERVAEEHLRWDLNANFDHRTSRRPALLHQGHHFPGDTGGQGRFSGQPAESLP